MNKVKVSLLLVGCGVFIFFMDSVYAFEVVTILTTSDVVEWEHQGEKILFEPGETVYIYVCTEGHCSGCRLKVDLKYVLYDPSGNIVEEYFYECPGHEDSNGSHIAYYYFDLSLSTQPGIYTVEVTIYDRNSNMKRVKKATFHVDYYTAITYVEEADSHYLKEDYEEAKTCYQKAKEEYERFAAEDRVNYCKERIVNCDTYILAEEYYSQGVAYIEKKDYRNAVYQFMKARDLFEKLGDQSSVEFCNSQIEEHRGVRLFLLEIREIPSLANFSITFWIICSYMCLRGLKENRRGFFTILAALAGIFSFIFDIMFYFFYL